MTYLGELRANMRPLLAASLGSGTSIPLFAYTNSVFSPYLIEEFGWSRAQFALIGVTMLATLLILPFVGRFTDRFGVKRMALIGSLLMPFGFIGYSLMQGSFALFLVLFTGVLMVGSLTGPLTYSRLIAENFQRATGLALTIMNCMPAVLAIAIVPVINWAIENVGWRMAYLGLGAFVASCSAVAILLIPRETRVQAAAPSDRPSEPHEARADYALILRSKVFWIIIAGMFLCLMQSPLHSSQMNLMLLENGLTKQSAANIVSVYALGTIVGRIACGLALDRFGTPAVTWISMGLPAIGYLLLGTDMDAVSIITVAMFLVGLSVGAESDLVSYLVARYFKLRIYGTTLGLVHTCTFLASAVGSLAISLTLALSDSFAPFLFLVAGTVTLGSLLFLLLPRSPREKLG